MVNIDDLVHQLEKMNLPPTFNTRKWLEEWLNQPLPALGGKCPIDHMDTEEGQTLISTLITRIESSAYS